MNDMKMCECTNAALEPTKETLGMKINAAHRLSEEIQNEVNALNEILYGCGKSNGNKHDEPVTIDAKLDFICGELNEIFNDLQEILNRMV